MITVGKTAALTVAFVGVFAAGVAVGPSLRDTLWSGHRRVADPAAATAESPAPEPAAAPARANTPKARATTAGRKPALPGATTSNTAPRSVVLASEPRLHARLKPVLNRGARMDVAAEGFRSAEQFA